MIITNHVTRRQLSACYSVTKISMFGNLEEIITDLRIEYNNIDVCIIGDLNARTGNASDVLKWAKMKSN